MSDVRSEAGHEAVRSSGGSRCPRCAGLVTAGAEWCGQCYASLRAEELMNGSVAGSASVAPVRAVIGGVEVADGRVAWECPACGERNPMEASACRVCETPFGRLLKEPAPRVEIAPRTALLWSLGLPGLGHWKAGHRGDGVARIVLFAWTLGTVVSILLSRSGGAGAAAGFPLLWLYAGSAAGVYVLSAIDAGRLAGGAPPVVSSRTLLWASVALVAISILAAIMVTLPAARR